MAEHNTAAPLPSQGQDLIYALDIGTRSIIGLLATRAGDRMCVQGHGHPPAHPAGYGGRPD